jgi:CRISPR system Cascade subunit CasD
VNEPTCLVLRLAGPMQSWGSHSQFNRRETDAEPTKSGIVGLLAAALGRRRADPIEDLLELRLGVRTDRPGSLLRDYHTLSDYRGGPLPSAAVNAKGIQKPTAPAKYTHVTQRYYLQDAVFVAAVNGPHDLLSALAAAVRSPAFPLALGRRSCVPTQPLLVRPTGGGVQAADADLWNGDPAAVLATVPWQARPAHGKQAEASTIDLPITIDNHDGNTDGADIRVDLPRSFDPLRRGFTARAVRHAWVSRPTTPGETAAGPPTATGPPIAAGDAAARGHDPFALLGW